MWANTSATAQQLEIIPRQLRRLRSQGLFKLGEHYRIASSIKAKRVTYLWHLERYAAVLEKPMNER